MNLENEPSEHHIALSKAANDLLQLCVNTVLSVYGARPPGFEVAVFVQQGLLLSGATTASADAALGKMLVTVLSSKVTSDGTVIVRKHEDIL